MSSTLLAVMPSALPSLAMTSVMSTEMCRILRAGRTHQTTAGVRDLTSPQRRKSTWVFASIIRCIHVEGAVLMGSA
jgi:hypothetical protein